MATYSNILAWKIPWMEEPGRLQSMGSQRVGHDWATSLHLAFSLNFRVIILKSSEYYECFLFRILQFYSNCIYHGFIYLLFNILFYLMLLCVYYTSIEIKVLVAQLCPTLCDPMDCSLSGSSVHDSPDKNTVVSSHSLLPGLFLTQESNPSLLHCKQILHDLSHQVN